MSHSITDTLALLVIDMQESFLNACEHAEHTQKRTSFAIKAARQLDIEVLFSEQVPDKLGRTLPDLLQAAPDAHIFAKTAFSALRAEGLLDYLKDKGYQHLLIAGIETPICVYQTTIDALAEGLDITILSDCITARRLDDAQVARQALQQGGAHCLPSETIFYSLLGDAEHPNFREITKLVKAYS